MKSKIGRQRQSSGDPWGKVRITCTPYEGQGMSLTDSEKEVLQMMKGFFPAGPQAAMRAHTEFKTWVKEGQAIGDVRYRVGGNTAWLPKEPVTEGVRQWDALRRSWENYTVWMFAAGPATPAEWDALKGVNFSQVQKQELKQSPKMRIRM
jgi:hypothetical protein